MLQIDKDVRRLCPDISFFSQATEFPNEKIASGQFDRLHQRVQQTSLKSQNLERKGLGIAKLSLLKKKATENYAPLPRGQEAHWEVVERILFLYAKLNPGQSYVQGMNEIIGPIYYVLASDPNNEWRGFDFRFRFHRSLFTRDFCFCRIRRGGLLFLFHKFDVRHQRFFHQNFGRGGKWDKWNDASVDEKSQINRSKDRSEISRSRHQTAVFFIPVNSL